MNIRDGNTQFFNDRVARCEDIDELKEILNINSSYYHEWIKFMTRVMEVNHLSYEKMGKLCKCSKNTVKKWVEEGKLPQNREAFLKIALGLGMDLKQTNEFLQRYGKYPKLYPKSIEDAICIYTIKHPDDTMEPYDYYLFLKDYFIKKIESQKKDRNNQEDWKNMNTEFFSQSLESKDTIKKFEQFIIDNYQEFQNTYHKLLEFLEEFILSKNNNIHEFITAHNLNAGFEKMLTNLKKRGEVPNRKKLIVLGLHLNMSLEQLNKMLELASMEELCSKDKVECAVLYAVESAYLNNPSYSYENAVALKNYVDNKELQEKCTSIIKDHWETKTYQQLETGEEYENMEEDISNYLKWILLEVEMGNEDIIEFL